MADFCRVAFHWPAITGFPVQKSAGCDLDLEAKIHACPKVWFPRAHWDEWLPSALKSIRKGGQFLLF
jgi:hypothetical protein